MNVFIVSALLVAKRVTVIYSISVWKLTVICSKYVLTDARMQVRTYLDSCMTAVW